MKQPFQLSLLIGATLCSATLTTADAPLLKLRAVPFTDVKIADSFWLPRQETNRLVSIPINFENLEKAGNLQDLRLAAQRATKGFQGPVFMDSDVYKAMEAASYSLATHPDAELEKKLDDIIATLAAAQQPDGYLNSYFIVKEPTKRWTNLRDWHELYCAGHMFEAAVAHFQATGKRSFLDVAAKLADHIDSVFGPPPRRLGYPGHPEIELALIKLWRATGSERYFKLAQFFIENRGRHFFATEHNTPPDKYDGSYFQDDMPIYDHKSIKGHAVRACYLMSGVTDVAAETRDARLLSMLNRVWRNTIERNMYLTGGIGPSAHNEGFTVDYDLPNLTAYQETCATIALAQWNHRMALLYGDAKYADVVERALYNGVLAGVSQDGTKFFYVNPLESRGNHHRSPWFGCACCPPNVARTLAALGGYAYATSDNALWVNLYIQGSVKAKVAGTPVEMDVTTDYPWDGKVTLKLKLAKPTKFELRLRKPGWSPFPALNDERGNIGAVVEATQAGYFVFQREWKNEDTVELDFRMPVQRVAANPNVKANQGLLALQRGPLVYCLEAVDHVDPLSSLYLPAETELKPMKHGFQLGDVIVLQGPAQMSPDQDWRHQLYQSPPEPRQTPLTVIPYFTWDNRQTSGAMKVWLPVAPPPPPVGGLESRAKVSVSFANDNCQPGGINDGIEPKSSGDQPTALCHWWPHKGTDEWVQYTWPDPVNVSGAKVYWFDDTGRGECRLPASWQIQVPEGNEWVPVIVQGGYPVGKDKWCEVNFTPVGVRKLRLAVKLQPNWAAGVHEWKIIEADEE